VEREVAQRNYPRRLQEHDEREKRDAMQTRLGNRCVQPHCHALVLSATDEPYLRRGSTLALIVCSKADGALADRLDAATPQEYGRELRPVGA